MLQTGRESGRELREDFMRTFSSSSFFSERCFRLRAVSSRLSAISASFSCFFFRDVSSMDPVARVSERSTL